MRLASIPNRAPELRPFVPSDSALQLHGFPRADSVFKTFSSKRKPKVFPMFGSSDAAPSYDEVDIFHRGPIGKDITASLT